MDVTTSSASMPLALKSSLSAISRSHTLRCDAKQAERRFSELDAFFQGVDFFFLGDVMPGPLVKGPQPKYLETLEPQGVPVISTLAIQRLRILPEECRYIQEAEFESIDPERRPRAGDLLLTMDGGPSIGKPAVFDLNEDYAVDSHVALLRPVGMKVLHLAYLLASPVGQLQFRRAESGASGQTAVTEDDLRRFRFPVMPEDRLDDLVSTLESARQEIERRRSELTAAEEAAWSEFNAGLSGA